MDPIHNLCKTFEGRVQVNSVNEMKSSLFVETIKYFGFSIRLRQTLQLNSMELIHLFSFTIETLI